MSSTQPTSYQQWTLPQRAEWHIIWHSWPAAAKRGAEIELVTCKYDLDCVIFVCLSLVHVCQCLQQGQLTCPGLHILFKKLSLVQSKALTCLCCHILHPLPHKEMVGKKKEEEISLKSTKLKRQTKAKCRHLCRAFQV